VPGKGSGKPWSGGKTTAGNPVSVPSGGEVICSSISSEQSAVVDLASRVVRVRLDRHVLAGAFDPARRRIAVALEVRTFGLFDADTGRSVMGLPSNAAATKMHTAYVTFSKDGRFLVHDEDGDAVSILDAGPAD
jgi:hypothetical protein